jgi:hypothetical protein
MVRGRDVVGDDEVSPEMIDAGADVYQELEGEALPTTVVREVYLAMRRAAGEVKCSSAKLHNSLSQNQGLRTVSGKVRGRSK